MSNLITGIAATWLVLAALETVRWYFDTTSCARLGYALSEIASFIVSLPVLLVIVPVSGIVGLIAAIAKTAMRSVRKGDAA